MGSAAVATSTQDGGIPHVLSFPSGWCNTHSKSAQKRLPEVLSAAAAIFLRFKERYTVQFTGNDRSMVK